MISVTCFHFSGKRYKTQAIAHIYDYWISPTNRIFNVWFPAPRLVASLLPQRLIPQ